MWPVKRLGLLVGLVVAFSFSVSAAEYVINVGPPSGVDDTLALQGALDKCVQEHPTGRTVQLSAGTYKTKQLFTAKFHGGFKGTGMDVPSSTLSRTCRPAVTPFG